LGCCWPARYLRRFWRTYQTIRPDFSFVVEGVAFGHHGLGYLKWREGPANGLGVVSGVDVTEVSDGRIVRLWILLDSDGYSLEFVYKKWQYVQ